MQQRDSSIDFLKGVAIVLMVLGHAVTNWAEGKWVLSFIGLFHMPVFFMAGFPASYHGWGWTVLYTIAGMGLPVSVSLIYGKIVNKIIRTT